MKFQMFPAEATIGENKRVKFGIDPTFPRLHLGHLVPIRFVRSLMHKGHHVIIVLGTFTAQLGDPSGRDTTRPILSKIEVKKNAESIWGQIEPILGEQNFGNNPGNWSICQNHELHEAMNVPEFMRIVSKFTLAHMTSRNAFQARIEHGQSIGMHELLVPICQGWDSVALKSEIEVGGQDQLFNFQIARQMQESEEQKPQTCILMPIINGTDGRKMSKSLGNCIFLDEEAEDMFGKIMSIPDTVMEEWFPLLVDFSFSEETQNMHPMEKKKILATEIVKQLHSEEDAVEANDQFFKIVQKKELPQDIPDVKADNLLQAIVIAGYLSKTAARQRLKDGAVKLDGIKVFDENLIVKKGQILQVGKRTFGRIV